MIKLRNKKINKNPLRKAKISYTRFATANQREKSGLSHDKILGLIRSTVSSEVRKMGAQNARVFSGAFFGNSKGNSSSQRYEERSSLALGFMKDFGKRAIRANYGDGGRNRDLFGSSIRQLGASFFKNIF